MLSPQRAQANLDEALAKIRTTTRMRFGVVAGIVIVGLFQINFSAVPDQGETLALVQSYLRTAFPVLAVAVAGGLVVMALRQRDIKRARDIHDSQVFRVPKRKS